MTALARFIMHGHSQAALVAATSALLSLLIPLFGLLSAASIGLVTLRQGWRQGLIVTGLATLGAGGLALLIFGSSTTALGMLVVLWLPLWALANLLRISGALTRTVQFAAVFSLLLVLVFHLSVADTAAYWLHILEPVGAAFVADGLMTTEAQQHLLQSTAQWMTGTFISAFTLQTLVSLFLARSWQAALYHPGGFGSEFRALHLGSRYSGLMLALLIGWSFAPGAGIVADLLLALSIFSVIQGLAVGHAVRQMLGIHGGWLVAAYFLLAFFMPQAFFIVAGVGLVDSWLDIRARVARRVNQPD